MGINKACATLQSSMGQIILVGAKTFYILQLTGSLNRQGRWDPKTDPLRKGFYLQGHKKDEVKVVMERELKKTLLECFRKRLYKIRVRTHQHRTACRELNDSQDCRHTGTSRRGSHSDHWGTGLHSAHTHWCLFRKWEQQTSSHKLLPVAEKCIKWRTTVSGLRVFLLTYTRWDVGGQLMTRRTFTAVTSLGIQANASSA